MKVVNRGRKSDGWQNQKKCMSNVNDEVLRRGGRSKPPHSSKHSVLPPAAAWQSVKVCIERRRTFMSGTNRNATCVCACVCPKREAQMLGCWRPIKGSFQVFFTWEKWFFSTCLSPAVMKQQFHSLSSVSALWVKSSNISDYFATLLQALPVQLSCWEVGYHHFF